MLLYKKIKFVCLLMVAYFRMICSNELIGCNSPNRFQEVINKETLDLRSTGDLAIYNDVGIISIISKTNNNFNKLYIDARLEETDDTTNLIIFTTQDFERYAKEQTANEIVLNIEFSCPGQVSKPVLLFSQPLKEDNYYSPQLSKELYIFSIPTPLYKGFEMTVFEEISARDDDIWENGINFFSSDSEDFNILTGTKPDSINRTYFASIKLTAIMLSLKERIEFSIIALDMGNPPRSSLPAKVIIESNSANSLPPIPRFIKTCFIGRIGEDGQFDKIEVILDPETYTDEVTFSKLSDHENIFLIESMENIVTVSLNEEFDLTSFEENQILTFDVEAKNINLIETGQTAVLIAFNSTKDVRFAHELYRTTLNIQGNNLSFDDLEIEIHQYNLEDTNFDLEGNYAYEFEIIISQNILKLQLKPFPSSHNWADICSFTLSLFATINGEKTASTIILVDVVKTTIAFEKPVYIGIIESDGNLEIEAIALLTHEKTVENMQIELNGAEELFSFTIEGNEIKLLLNEPFLYPLTNQPNIKLQILASYKTTGLSANCTILIQAIHNLIFHKNVYEANIDSEANLEMENIILNKSFTGDAPVQFELLGPYISYFTFEQSENTLKLSLTPNFNITEQSTVAELWVEVGAQIPELNLSASTIVLVTILQDIVPEFEKRQYVGELLRENILNLDKLILKISTWRTYTNIEIKGEHSEFFELFSDKNVIEILPKLEHLKKIAVSTPILLEVIARNSNRVGYTTVVINLQQNPNGGNMFKKSIQKGKVRQTNSGLEVLDIADIELERETNVIELKCDIKGDEASNFEYTVVVPKNSIKIVQTASLPNDVAISKYYTTLLLECQHKENDDVFGSIMIFLELPGTSVGCPTQEPPVFIPEFSSSIYHFRAKPNYVGSLKAIHAIIKDSNSRISYYLHVENEHLRSRINIDESSGEIFLLDIVSPGKYYFNIIAQNTDTKNEAMAMGVLEVQALIQCDDHTFISNSLIIKHLQEEIEHYEIMNTTFENCQFFIFSMEPNDKDYFSIHSESKMLTMISIDREDPIFSRSSPQIEVKLQLNCTDNQKSLQRNKRDIHTSDDSTENKPLLLTHDLTFSKDITLLSVVLVDINDNYPTFIYPKEKHLVVGYPELAISMQVLSEYVVQVIARDDDDGLNAVIRYSMQPNNHFQINPISGKIYPYANAMIGMSELNLTVHATDRNGADDGLSSEITLIIKSLTSQHFTLLTFVKSGVNSIDSLMMDVKNRTGLEFVPVKFATVSISNDSIGDNVPKFKSDTEHFVQKVWAYAFRGNEPVSSNDIKRMLSQFKPQANIRAQTFDDVMSETEHLGFVSDHNITGYIVALCILAIILIASTGFIGWKYVHQSLSRPQTRVFRNSTPGATLNQNLKGEIDMQKQADLINDAVCEPSFYSKRESVKIFGTTINESSDDVRRQQMHDLNAITNGRLQEESEENETDSNSSKLSIPPRATVTFNELVEKIHIGNRHIL